MLTISTRDRTWPLEESGGPLVQKDRESNVESWHFQGYNPCLCRLRTDGLAFVRKY
jgi:hypothetical protein